MLCRHFGVYHPRRFFDGENRSPAVGEPVSQNVTLERKNKMEPIGIGVMLFVFVIWAIMECRKSPEERVAEKQIKLEKM